MKKLITNDFDILVVDLDGTLLKTDLLIESFIKTVSESPWVLFQVFFWLLKGRLYLKTKLFSKYKVMPELLPYEQKILDLVFEARSAGKTVVLASASFETVVKPIADHLHCFDMVLASDPSQNVKGEKKLAKILRFAAGKKFAYVGDTWVDIPVWKAAAKAIVINPSTSLSLALKNLGIKNWTIQAANLSPIKTVVVILRQLRAHQWAKNFLIFVPLIAAHHFLEIGEWVTALIGFMSFCAISSSVYVFNDLSDLEADRRHTSKKHRPFASGALPLLLGFILVPILVVLSAALAWQLPLPYKMCLLTYLFTNLLYTFVIKRTAVLDVVVLSLMYTIRIIAGGAVIGVPISDWLLAFSTFLFFGLAMVKRYVELAKIEDREVIHSRGYQANDRDAVYTIGVVSTFLAILILILYLNSDEIKDLYKEPNRIWVVIPLLLYWNARLWIFTKRKLIHDDPVVFAIKDPITWIVVVMFLIVMLMAI